MSFPNNDTRGFQNFALSGDRSFLTGFRHKFQTYTATGGESTINTLSGSPDSFSFRVGLSQLFVVRNDGQKFCTPTVDYIEVDANTLSFNVPFITGEKIFILKMLDVASPVMTVPLTIQNFTAKAFLNQQIITLPWVFRVHKNKGFQIGEPWVFINKQLLMRNAANQQSTSGDGDYYEVGSDGIESRTIYLNSPIAAGTAIMVLKPYIIDYDTRSSYSSQLVAYYDAIVGTGTGATHSDLQDAIDEVGAGSRILIISMLSSTGITVNKNNLTIEGRGAACGIQKTGSTPGAIGLDITASGVKIQNITIKDFSDAGDVAIDVSGESCTILGNWFDTNTTDVDASSVSEYVIHSNNSTNDDKYDLVAESGDKTINLTYSYLNIHAIKFIDGTSYEVSDLPYKRGASNTQIVVGLGDDALTGELRIYRI